MRISKSNKSKVNATKDTVCASSKKKVVYDKDGIKVTETGNDYDFIATIENDTDKDYHVEGSGFDDFIVSAHDWVGLMADEEGYTVLNYFKWLDVPPLTKDQVKELWDTTALFIEWGDGSDSMCQDNGYTLDEILDAMDHGGRVYIDEDPTDVNACGDVKASTKFNVGDEVYIDKGNLPRIIGIVDSIDGDDITVRDWRNEQLTYHPNINKVHKRDLRASTDTDKALQHIKAAIDILGKSGNKDAVTKDSIANLGVVMFDLIGKK